MKKFESELDSSVNWIRPSSSGFYECRFVQRYPEYFVCYLSCQSGCNYGCKFCHLTSTRQVRPHTASVEEIWNQAQTVLDHARSWAPETHTVHFNFMARGEPLSPCSVSEAWPDLSDGLIRIARRFGWQRSKILISSIFPRDATYYRLSRIFQENIPEIYYSLYSMNPEWRRKWVPKAMPARSALRILKEWQDDAAKIPKIHYAFIGGENDSERDVSDICDAINDEQLRVDVNIVRYNPPNGESRESSEATIVDRAHQMEHLLLPGTRVRVVDRVGFDVAASCGMFASPEGEMSHD